MFTCMKKNNDLSYTEKSDTEKSYTEKSDKKQKLNKNQKLTPNDWKNLQKEVIYRMTPDII